MNKNYFAPGAVYHDYHRDITINATSNVSEVLKAVMTEDVEEQPAPEPSTPYSPPIPREGDYNGVRLYIEERKRYDQDFKTFCQNHNRKDLCSFLTKQFGWYVDDNSLCQNIRRNM